MRKNQIGFKARHIFKCLFIFLLPLALILVSASSSPSRSESIGTSTTITSDQKWPTSNDTKKKEPIEVIVVIDAGHGGNDWGTHHGSMKEKTINLDIALKLGPLLQSEGIKIVYTREKDVFIPLKDRAEIANKINATLFISIHNNKMPGDSKYKGTETLYAANSNSRFDTMTDKRLARIVQDTLVENLKTSDKGIIYRPGLAVLHRTTMPAIIAEIGYISNSSDRERLASNTFRKKAAAALSEGVIKALKEMGASKNSDGKWIVVGSQK